MKCIRCNREINERRETMYRSIQAWEKVAPGRAAAGPVIMRKPSGKFMCVGCVTLIQEGIVEGQEQLL